MGHPRGLYFMPGLDRSGLANHLAFSRQRQAVGYKRTVAMYAYKCGLFISLGLSMGLIALALGLLRAMSQSPLAVAHPLVDSVSGVITQSTTWDLVGSPYTLTGNVVVTAGVTLTVDLGWW